jgi:hypothetical protein
MRNPYELAKYLISEIHEPTTALTDLLLAASGSVMALLLLRRTRAVAQRSWALALGASALGALAGALFHGWGHLFHPRVRFLLWKSIALLLSLASLAMFAATLYSAFGERARQRWLLGGLSKTFVFTAWNLVRHDFAVVVYDYLSSMFAILGIQLSRRQAPGSGWLLAGLFTSFVAAAIQQNGKGFHQHFNHNDIFHLIQLAGMYFFYRGALQVEDHTESASARGSGDGDSSMLQGSAG